MSKGLGCVVLGRYHDLAHSVDVAPSARRVVFVRRGRETLAEIVGSMELRLADQVAVARDVAPPRCVHLDARAAVVKLTAVGEVRLDHELATAVDKSPVGAALGLRPSETFRETATELELRLDGVLSHRIDVAPAALVVLSRTERDRGRVGYREIVGLGRDHVEDGWFGRERDLD